MSNQFKPYTYKIQKIEQNPFCDIDPQDPEALYMYEIGPDNSICRTGSGISYAEVKHLMRHFQVDSPRKLAGQTFTSKKDSAGVALDYLIFLIKHGGVYTPPSFDTIYQEAAASLATMKCPDFSRYDNETVYKAFQSVFNGFDLKPEWLNQLKKSVADISANQVEINPADYNDFSLRVRGPAEYFYLQKVDKRIYMIIGPYSTPVTFH